jgi:nicotinamidase-related amidase
MAGKNAFLIIDAQYDFCNPKGALFVPGADEDMARLSTLIRKQAHQIDHIVVTLDTHPVLDISHPTFWQDQKGNFPPPFTPIATDDIRSGRWTPRYHQDKATRYVENLEKQGEFGHFIWPEHCLWGSRGAALDNTLLEALLQWTRSGKDYQAVIKGTNPLTEHFGIFKAQIPIDEAPETHLNRTLIDQLMTYNRVYLAGEAKSHCVATSLKQVLDHAPQLTPKLVVLEDCSSDVTGLGHLGDPIYAEARRQGVRFLKSTEVEL